MNEYVHMTSEILIYWLLFGSQFIPDEQKGEDADQTESPNLDAFPYQPGSGDLQTKLNVSMFAFVNLSTYQTNDFMLFWESLALLTYQLRNQIRTLNVGFAFRHSICVFYCTQMQT